MKIMYGYDEYVELEFDDGTPVLVDPEWAREKLWEIRRYNWNDSIEDEEEMDLDEDEMEELLSSAIMAADKSKIRAENNDALDRNLKNLAALQRELSEFKENDLYPDAASKFNVSVVLCDDTVMDAEFQYEIRQNDMPWSNYLKYDEALTIIWAMMAGYKMACTKQEKDKEGRSDKEKEENKGEIAENNSDEKDEEIRYLRSCLSSAISELYEGAEENYAAEIPDLIGLNDEDKKRYC